MHQAAASLETIQVLALFSQRCITHAHCARYNLQIFNNYPAKSRGISSVIIQQIVTLSKYGHDALDICHP